MKCDSGTVFVLGAGFTRAFLPNAPLLVDDYGGDALKEQFSHFPMAHRFEKLIRDGDVRDFADLARLGRVSRATLTQIVNLLCVAPDIQEQILFLPPVERRDDRIHERQLPQIAAMLDCSTWTLRWQPAFRAFRQDPTTLWERETCCRLPSASCRTGFPTYGNEANPNLYSGFFGSKSASVTPVFVLMSE